MQTDRDIDNTETDGDIGSRQRQTDRQTEEDRQTQIDRQADTYTCGQAVRIDDTTEKLVRQGVHYH